MSVDQALLEKAKALVVLKGVLGDLYESHKKGILDGLAGVEMVWWVKSLLTTSAGGSTNAEGYGRHRLHYTCRVV